MLRHKFALKARPERPTMLVDQGRLHPLQKQTSFAVVSSDNIYPTSDVMRSAATILRYLSALYLMDPMTSPETFPEALVESEGQPSKPWVVHHQACACWHETNVF